MAPQIVTKPLSQTVIVGAPATFTVTASGSEPLAYQWNKNDAPIVGASESSFRIPTAGLNDAGNYSVTVSNTAGSTTTIGVTLTVTKIPQSISFTQIADKIYGDDSFALTAMANSGLPVSFSVISGPVTLKGNTVTIMGAGLVMIRASQAGDENHEPAVDITETFNVAKKALTVRVGDLARTYGTANPSLNFTLTGFVYNDTASLVSGSATLSTTATPTSIVGIYPITVEPGTLNAANYTFTLINGTLAINKADQTISFAPLIRRTYGDLPFNLAASSDSGLPVSFSIISGPANATAGTLSITGAGTVTVHAIQPGDGNYNSSSSVDQSFTVTKAPLIVTADDTTRSYGEANPTFSAVFAGFVNGDSVSAISGTVEFSSTANTTSPPGAYVITAQLGTFAYE